jgi:6-pyruvoyltetrahydropterin/6-carboxytetrahydropterin synthase
MFTISIETTFNASHQLTLPDGSKEPLHSHNWALIVAVCSEKLNEMGLVMDFCHLKTIINQTLAVFENVQLEDTNCFDRINASAENVARYLYARIKGFLPAGVKLKFVRVTEAPGCNAEYSMLPIES